MATRTLLAPSLGSGSVSELSDSYFYDSDKYKNQAYLQVPTYGTQLQPEPPSRTASVNNVIILPIPTGASHKGQEDDHGQPDHRKKLNLLEKSLLGKVVMENRRPAQSKPRGQMTTLELLQQMTQLNAEAARLGAPSIVAVDPTGRRTALASRLSRKVNTPHIVNGIPVGMEDFHLPFLNKYEGLGSLLDVRAEQLPPAPPKELPPSKVDLAVATVKRMKTIWREDAKYGVPRSRQQSTGNDTSIDSADPHSRRGVGFADGGSLDENNQQTRAARHHNKSDNTRGGNSQIKGQYKFPKIADFISREPTLVEGAGVEFKIPASRSASTSDPLTTRGSSGRSRSGTKSVTSVFTSSSSKYSKSKTAKSLPADSNNHGASTSGMKPSTTIPGQRCKAFYPVAEALRRENTAVECRRGRALGQGEWKVTKVWHRDLQDVHQLVPIQVAREDVSKGLTSRQREILRYGNHADTNSSVELDDSTMSRDSLSDDLSSGLDGRNDMYTIAEEEE